MATDALMGGPLSLVARGYERFLAEVQSTDAWTETVRSAAATGAVVHVLRNVSLIDLLALESLARRIGLPEVRFANEHRAWLRRSPRARLGDTLASGGSAVLFMKRAPGVIARAGPALHRGLREGEDLLETLVAIQRTQPEREIVLVPEVLVWTKRPERLGFSVIDTLFGPSEFPGDLRAAMQFLLNHKNGVVRAAEPVRLSEFLAQSGADGDEVVARRLSYALLRKIERERRSILGPMQKPADRVREEVLRSPKLQTILKDLAGSGAAERRMVTEKARGMLRELQANPDPPTLRGLEILADPLIERVYAGLDVDEAGIERVREAARKGSLVFLPSHKSHVDYMLLTYVLRKHAIPLPVIAAGDNLAFFPVGPVFRRAGAFFIRRNFKGDRLYTAVVDAYIRRIIRDGWPLEFFLEGRRSRTGKLYAPQLGLLNMVVDATLALENKTVTFVPVSIGYERTMEESSFAHELSGGSKKKEDAAALFKLADVLGQSYGRANVQFGTPIELAEMQASIGSGGGPLTPAKRRALVTRLAHRVMSEINRVTAVTPGSLVATALLCHPGRGLSHVDLVAQCARLTALVRSLGARTSPSLTRSGGSMREQAIREAAVLYVRSGIVRQHVPGDTLTGTARRRARIYTGDDVVYTLAEERRLVLDLSKNLIVHLFVDRALVSVALRSGGAPARREALHERVLSLSRLFKLEFMFRADAGFDAIFEQTLQAMIACGELAVDGELIRAGLGHDGLDGRGWLRFYGSVVQNFLEGYRVAARTVRVLAKGPLPEDDLVARALRVGGQMLLGGEIERAEALSGPVFENAYGAFVDQGYLARGEGKLHLSGSFADEESARAIEARVAGYLARPDDVS